MMANSKEFLARKRYVRQALSVFTLACTVWGADLTSSANAHGPNCGCGNSNASFAPKIPPSCGPQCGIRCEDQCERVQGTMNVAVHSRKLSFAEKFLRQMDKVGDKIEANILPLPQAACTTCGPAPGSEATCGVELGEPSCGLEFPSADCGCNTCASGRGLARPGRRRSAAQNYQYASPNESEEYVYDEEIYYEDSSDVVTPQPDANSHRAPSSRANPNQAAPSPSRPQNSAPQPAAPAKQPELKPVPQNNQVPRSPSNSAPSNPAPSNPAPSNPAPSNPAPSNQNAAPKQTAPNAAPSNSSAPPKLELPPSFEAPQDDFTPRRPNSSAPSQPSTPSVVPNTPPSIPSQPPTLQLPEVKDPIQIPSPNNPRNTTPLENMEDILVDPFKDDLSFQHRRNRMNGMEISNRMRIEDQTSRRAEISNSSSSRLQNNSRAQFVPASSRISDAQRGVQHASNEEPVVYSQRPTSYAQEAGAIMQMSHQEQVGQPRQTTGGNQSVYRSSKQSNAPVYQRPRHPSEPQVSRVPVPNRR